MLKVTQSPERTELVVATRRQWLFRRTVAGAGILVLIVVVAGIGLYWQLTRHSISLGFMAARVEQELKQRMPAGAQVSVGATALAYRSGQGVVLKISDLQMSLPGTATVAAQELSTSTTLAALFSRQVDLRSVTASGLSIGVSAAPHLDPQTGSGADLLRRASLAFMGQVLKADGIMRGAGLQQVVINDATIHLDDQARLAGPALKIASANWLPIASDRSKAWMEIAEKDGKSWDFVVERRITQDGQSALTVEAAGVPTTTLLPQLAGLDGGPYLRSLVTLQMRMAEAKDGSFQQLRGVLSTAGGTLSFTGNDEVTLDSTSLAFGLEREGNQLSLPNGEVRTRTGRMQFEGVADLTEIGEITLLCRVRNGFLPTPIGGEHTVEITGGGGQAVLNVADVGIKIEHFELATPQGTASVVGQASLGGANAGLSFALSIGEMPAATMRALWPPFVASKTRGWFDLNVKGGTLGPATLSVALPPEFIGPRNRGKVLPDTALVGTVPFHDAEFSPIRTFPSIKNALGGITFGSATASIWAQSGVMQVPDKGDLQAGGTTLIIGELGRTEPRGDLHLELSGAASALAVVSDTAPLGIAHKHGIVADSLSGNAALSLDATIPIYESDFADVIPTFRLALTDFTSTTAIDSRMVEKANLVLEGSPKSYTVKGLGRLDGFDAAVNLILGTAAPDTSAVTIELDAAARERLGFRFGDLLTGPVLASLTHSSEPRQQVALDLKQARISLPFLGWEKGPGVPATASFTMEKTAKGTDVSNFILSGKGFEVRGGLTLGTDGRVKTIDFDKVSLRSGDQLAVSAVANGHGYDVKVHGGSLDARAIIKGVGSGLAGGTADIFPVRVTLDVDEVKGQNDVALSNVTGKLTVTAKGLDMVALKGSSPTGQPFEWTVGREGDTRVMRLFADGGGALIRFSGIYSRVADGNLIVDYSGPVGGTGTGVAVIRNFRLINENALASAVETAKARRDMAQAYADDSTDMHFRELRIPFKQNGWVITIDDAALRGSALGATASGTINLPDAKMALSGTFIPAYGINNIAGAIPIIGPILGGGRNEGLVGITYRMFGPLDDPKLEMNPLSAIAPGIFRKIFEYR